MMKLIEKYNEDFKEINNIGTSNWSLRKKTKKLNHCIRMLSDDRSMIPGVQAHYDSGFNYKNVELVSEQALKEDKFHLRGKNRVVSNEHPIVVGGFIKRIIKDCGISETNFEKMCELLRMVVIAKEEQERLDKKFKTKMPFDVEDIYNISLEDVYARLDQVGIKVVERKVA